MAHDVTLMGATYPAVPAILVPSGSGTARYTDVTDTTATAADVLAGKVFHAADGTLTAGTGSGGDDGSFKGVIERTAATPTLPSNLTSIGTYAFYGCSNLALTSLPNGVTSIGTYAFYGCGKLELTSLPSGVTSIGNYAFRSCSNLALTSLPSNLTSIGSNAFYGCSKLALTSLPSGVTSIDSNAFYGCSNLALTSLPSSVKTIAGSAFYNCESIPSIECDGTITTLGNSAFGGTTAHPMQLASASFPNLAVSSLGTAFGNNTASYACKLLAFADMGKTKAIAANAFANCNALRTLVLRRTDAICTLSNVSAFLNTPMRGYSSLTGTVYVPSALISTYQTATNWKTLYDGGTLAFAAIEGSQYEL